MVEEFPGPVAVIAGGLSHERDISLASGGNGMASSEQIRSRPRL